MSSLYQPAGAVLKKDPFNYTAKLQKISHSAK